MRARVASVAAVWLALHVCLLISVPTTLCSMESVAAVGRNCSCPHAAGTHLSDAPEGEAEGVLGPVRVQGRLGPNRRDDHRAARTVRRALSRVVAGRAA